ncbi:MAG TPA: serine/threonine-protein kinase [Geothrix sp.]|nr:serine/threonine-protein kinase [Geothrix sp.]
MAVAIAGVVGFAQKRKGVAPKAPRGGTDPNLQRDFGPYRVLRLLGEGGCASAYLGVHRATGAEVAIKVPHRHLAQDPQFRIRFLREASLGAKLHHPKIVRILTPSPQVDDLWLAMEYVKGTTLQAYLRQNGRLPVSEVIRVAMDLAGAIAHAHEQGVVHRDLKPANIMLNEQGAWVMDFGIARVLDATGTTSTMFLGTPAYAAPECLANPQVGPSADRYALGLILFEMLAGYPAFTGASAFQILECQRVQALPSLADIRPDLPSKLVDLVNRLCEKDPNRRPDDEEALRCLQSLKPNASSPQPSGAHPECVR